MIKDWQVKYSNQMRDQIFVNTLIFLQRIQPKAFCKQNTFTKGNEKINLI